MEKTTMTKTQKFANIRAFIEGSSLPVEEKEMYSAFLTHEIEMLSKKSTSKKEKENADSNEILSGQILDILRAEVRCMTIGNLLEKLPKTDSLNRPVTCQRITAILSKLVKEEKVNKSIEKRVSYYIIAG